jgi:serine/threonine-protein kinase
MARSDTPGLHGRPTPSDEGRPLVGDVIAGKYRIDSVAGEGGMGIVYEAEHVILRQRVAVKALLPGAVSSAEAVERFSLEAAAIARITNEHVVRIMDAGSLPNGAPYLVMEYLDGCDLAELLVKRGRLAPAEVVDYALQALEALAHAHAARVIHRDLKPANIFLARGPGGREVVKLLDFGIAKSFDSTSDGDRVFGSPMYMSPEQLRNRAIDTRTDLWSLGVVIYELVSGAPPFSGEFSELVTAILEKDAPPLHDRVPGVARDLSQAIARCLRRRPDDRWRTAGELATALAPHGTGAWTSALENIDRALAAIAPARAPRRFESLENALQALDVDWHPASVAGAASMAAGGGAGAAGGERAAGAAAAGGERAAGAAAAGAAGTAAAGAAGAAGGERAAGAAAAGAADGERAARERAEGGARAAHPVHGAPTVIPPKERVPPAPHVSTLRSASGGYAAGYGDTMPAPPSHADDVKIPLSPLSSKPALRILLIDDSELTLEIHQQALTDAGFDVRTTMSASEFDALLETWQPHLVVMDVQMPRVSGDALCAKVKAKFRAKVPVMFLSDLPRDELAARARAGGAEAFLAKSGDLPGFVDFVRNICAITYSPEDLP